MPKSQDILTLLAPMLRVRAELQDFCRFGGDWRSSHAAEEKGWAAFHIVTKGACSIERAGQPSVHLSAGDVLLLPHGDAHLVYGGNDRSKLRDVAVTYRDYIRIKETKDGAVDTELVCGRLILERATDNLLLRTLPHLIVLRLGMPDKFHSLVEVMRDELELDRAGSAAIARDLASAIFVMLLRAHFDTNPPVEGLIALLGQRETAKATAAMLGDPARNWRLDELAAIAAVSRSTLVRSFQRVSGMPPLTFLTEVRLGIARNRITQTSDALAQIAEDTGYQSEEALSRAFHRRFAIRPGALRREGLKDGFPIGAGK